MFNDMTEALINFYVNNKPCDICPCKNECRIYGDRITCKELISYHVEHDT